MAVRRKTILIWSAVAAATTALVVVAISLWLLAPAKLRVTIEQKLSDRLGLPVTIEELSLTLVPRPKVSGSHLVVGVPSRPDLPPFLTIQHFWVNVGLLSGWRGHVGTVHVGGLEIAVPPDDVRATMTSGSGGPSGIVVDRLLAHDAKLTIVRRKPGQPPLVFKIHELGVNDIGFDRKMSYEVRLTNAVPEGLVQATGEIGPWQRGNPAGLPLSGDYKFSLANLGTIRGIGGMLTSEGKFSGHLTEIVVNGRTETPDFNLDLGGGKPVPLSTTFQAAVNGSDGSVRLDSVDAKMMSTLMHVMGTVNNLPGPGGHSINLKAEVTDGRIEDVLALAAHADKPMMTGQVRLTGDISLPPGPRPVRDRLQVAGGFVLDRGRFTDPVIETKLLEFSRRTQGKQNEQPVANADDRVFTRMSGRYRLASGTLRLTDLRFSVPGALVTLNGTYSLPTAKMAFTGTLRMEATVSQAVGGLKSFFLRPFDRLFRRDGAGAVVPIQITGTRDAPKTSVRFGQVFSRGK